MFLNISVMIKEPLIVFHLLRIFFRTSVCLRNIPDVHIPR
ncbi:hypothetical protein RA11412_0236 [Rothia aeria]|uniref:Uncharacterized protein n=1 Tax=Rothia aeria TaxID=172042 RepID=A0A2Z5QVU9_9MICC|nr:hypothetical protein RA11412_0236 [Rothia aeria]